MATLNPPVLVTDSTPTKVPPLAPAVPPSQNSASKPNTLPSPNQVPRLTPISPMAMAPDNNSEWAYKPFDYCAKLLDIDVPIWSKTSRKFRRMSCYCCATTGCLAVILMLILGIAILCSPQPRKQKVAAFRNAVDSWNHVRQKQFLKLNGSLVVRIGNVTSTAGPNTTSLPFPDNGEDLPSYSTLSFTANFSLKNYTDSTIFPEGDAFIEYQSSDEGCRMSLPLSSAHYLPFSRKTKSDSEVLKEICFIVRPAPNATCSESFAVSNLGGCYPQPSSGDISFGRYDKILPNSTTNYVLVTVKSEDDPYLQALQITKGSLQFGVLYNSVFLGIFMIVSGVVPLMCCCICCSFAKRYPSLHSSIDLGETKPDSVAMRGVVLQNQRGHHCTGGHRANLYQQHRFNPHASSDRFSNPVGGSSQQDPTRTPEARKSTPDLV